MSDPLGLIGNSGGIQQPGMAKAREAAGPGGGPSFKDVLMDNIEQVNKLQREAEGAIEDLAAGRRDDMSNVMIAKQKADVAFQMLLQVRNKMHEAYEEIKQLRV